MVRTRSYFIAFTACLLVAAIVMQGCGSRQLVTESSARDGYYKNSAATDRFRSQVEQGFQSIRRLQHTVMYRTYLFDPDQTITRSQIGAFKFENVAVATEVESVSNAGTATVLSNNGLKAVFLTAAHAVTRADTVLHFYDVDTGSTGDRVEAVSVKVSENQFVIADNGIVGLDLVVSNQNKDLALIISNEPIEEQYNLEPLNLDPGRFDDVEWGDMVYAMGYPRGVQMITQGVASLSNHPHRSLVMDININRGYSGGAVFAVRADGSGLEWVGMITSAMGERELYLAPEDDIQTEYNPEIPYRGNIYVENRPMIYYGIAYAVDINEIRRFIRENANELKRRGGSISGLF
jgi:S1-C subfamily serine protease